MLLICSVNPSSSSLLRSNKVCGWRKECSTAVTLNSLKRELSQNYNRILSYSITNKQRLYVLKYPFPTSSLSGTQSVQKPAILPE